MLAHASRGLNEPVSKEASTRSRARRAPGAGRLATGDDDEYGADDDEDEDLFDPSAARRTSPSDSSRSASDELALVPPRVEHVAIVVSEGGGAG